MFRIFEKIRFGLLSKHFTRTSTSESCSILEILPYFPGHFKLETDSRKRRFLSWASVGTKPPIFFPHPKLYSKQFVIILACVFVTGMIVSKYMLICKLTPESYAVLRHSKYLTGAYGQWVLEDLAYWTVISVVGKVTATVTLAMYGYRRWKSSTVDVTKEINSIQQIRSDNVWIRNYIEIFMLRYLYG